MIPAAVVIGIDVSRDWLDGFSASSGQRLCLPNTVAGHALLLTQLEDLPRPVRVEFEAAGGQEWRLWSKLVTVGVEAVQLPPAQIKAFAPSRGTRAKTGPIDAELIARFMLFRPEDGRKLPGENLRILKAATTCRTQMVGMRKRLSAQIAARKKQHIPADLKDMDANLFAMLDAQVGNLEQRTKGVIGQEETSAAKTKLLLSIPGIGPISAAMPIAGMPELGRMTFG